MKKLLLIAHCSLLISGAAHSADYQGAGMGAARSAMGMATGAAATAATYRAPTLPPANTGGGTASPSLPSNPTQPAAPVAVAYSVDSCMNDVNACVENNLPGGVVSMYNADIRNSIINGMNICGSQIDKCVNQAQRVDGNRAYYSKNDVWVDFNSRIVQPAYYSQTLIRTGLTPNQAENTCWLLDTNVSGSSFAGVTTQQQKAGQPLGSGLNKDWARNSYARWDASNSECKVRVAAYNKGDLITNDWFHGAFGDKRPAEQWLVAGTTFKCAKETFEFNLMNDTSTAAMWSGIGTVAAAGIGAGVGAIAANKEMEDTTLNKELCNDPAYRDLLNRTLKQYGKKEVKNYDECAIAVCTIRQSNATNDCTPEQVNNDSAGGIMETIQPAVVPGTVIPETVNPETLPPTE